MDVVIRKQFGKFFSLLTEKYGLNDPQKYMSNVCLYGGSVKRLCKSDVCRICFAKSFSSSEKSQFWCETNVDNPRDVSISSNKLYKFKCGVCNHIFEISPGNIKHGGKWCPYCANQKLCMNECAKCYVKSFASADMAANWGSKNEKDPRTIFKHSGSKYWFEYKCCLHQFLSAPCDIQKGSWCPYCSSKKLCDDKTCSFCMIKSFASCDKSKHLIGDTNPREVFMNSNKMFSFRCENCSHIFSSSPNRINFFKHWCPYCCIPSKTLCNDVDCDKCFKRSFASSQRAIYWSTKNPCKPRDVMLNSHTKFMFTCDICTHDFSTSPHSIQNMNSWCPRCVRKTEVKLYNWLLTKFPDTISQAQFDWCTNPSTNRKLPYDFYIPSIKCIIELDGPQHFIQVSNWSDPESQKERDLYKMQLALDRGYAIIRIIQEDVFRDRNNWDINLSAQFAVLSYGRVVCIGDKQLYQDHYMEPRIDTKHTPY